MRKMVLSLLLGLCSIISFGQAPSGDALARWHGDKYSMFIHFGVYSKLGGVWKGEPVKRGYSEQIQAHAGIYSDVYEGVAESFNPDRFNADDIAALAKAAGMRSIVITTKHHDGFCMFKTATTKFNSWDTPAVPRDFIAELSEACRKAGLKFGLYFSIIDWHDPYGHPISSHNGDPSTPEHHNLNMKQVAELCSNYGPISELWFDMGSLTPGQSKDLYDLVHRLQPNCMVSGRLGNDCYDFCVMGDNSYPDGTLKTAWQTPASMFNETWGYRSWQKRGDPAEKASEKLHSLLGTVSHGGNFLLNIGPKDDGGIVDFERDVLLRIGKWLGKNGDAVYDTEAFAWPGIDKWGYCTKKGQNIYLIPSKLSADTTVVLNTGGARLIGAEHLDDGIKVEARTFAGQCRVKIFAYDAGEMPRVTRLRFDRPVAEPARSVISERNPVLDIRNAVPDYSYSCFDYYSNYRSTIAYNWDFTANGAKSISVTAPADQKGRELTLTLDGEDIPVRLGSDGTVALGSAAQWGEPFFAVCRESISDSFSEEECKSEWKPATGTQVKNVPWRGCACIKRIVTVKNECDLAIEVTSRSGMALHLNGEEIARHLNPYGCTSRKEQYVLHLNAGENVICLQSFNIGDRCDVTASINPAPENISCRAIVTLPAALKGGTHSISVKPADAANPHSDIELSNTVLKLN